MKRKFKLGRALCLILLACALMLSACDINIVTIDPNETKENENTNSTGENNNNGNNVPGGNGQTGTSGEAGPDETGPYETGPSGTEPNETIIIDSETATDTIFETETDIHGHTHISGEWIIDVEATKTENGLRHNECSICGVPMSEEIIYATGSEGLEYKFGNNKTCLITGIGTCKDKEIYIPSQIDGYNVSQIANGAFANVNGITEITFLGEIETIGTKAFYNCRDLKFIDIPQSVKKIGVSAFENCVNLAECNLPNNLQIITNSLFSGCENLESVVIPSSVTNIGNNVFNNCNRLVSGKVLYSGTMSQWKSITKDDSWNYGIAILMITCSDGEINESPIYQDFALIVLPEELKTGLRNGIGDATVAEDGSYINLPGVGAGDGWLLAFMDNTAVGKYVVIKYRFNNASFTNRLGFCSNVNEIPTSGENQIRAGMPVVSDGQWHIAVYNMAEFCGDGQLNPNDKGEYIIRYWRMDIADYLAADASVDIAYVGIVTDINAVIDVATKQGDKKVEVSETVDAVTTYYTSTGTTTPAAADVVNVFVGPEVLLNSLYNAGRMNAGILSQDGSYVSWTTKGNGGDGWILPYQPRDSVVSGQYMVVKYRFAAENAYAATYIEVFTSCTNPAPTGGDNLRFDIKADGEWHIAVVDLAKAKDNFTANEDGTYTVKYLRLDILDSNQHNIGDNLDLAYVALTDNIDNIIAANKDVEAIDYQIGDEKYTLYTATGTTVPAPEFFFGPEQLSTKVFNRPDKADVTIADDGSYIRFARKAEFSDGTLMLLIGNTQVTGQYVVIKYRTDHMNAGEFWANTVTNGHESGKANIMIHYITDGEWHIKIVDLAAAKPEYIVAAEDGTYTIQWSRIDILNNPAAEGYMDLAYIIFTDDLSEAAAYMTEEEMAACEHAVIKDGTCALCGFITEINTD